MTSAGRLYFPNLNGLRFIAAAAIFVDHVEWMKRLCGVPNHAGIPAIFRLGDLGVTLFFVLSGFLITYLLLEEKRRTGAIEIVKFYQRRMLRIWPLYYLTVLLAFLVLPAFITLPTWSVSRHEADFGPRFALYLLLLPNLAQVTLPLVPFAAQLWSVGVEEQFYAFWPLVCRVANRRIPQVLLGVIAGLVGLRLVALGLSSLPAFTAWGVVAQFLYYFRIPAMALGAGGAWLLQERSRTWWEPLFAARTQWAALLVSTALNVCPIDVLGQLRQEVSAFLYAVLIVNAAANPQAILKLEHPVLRYLGRISYGFYIYQILALRIVFLALQRIGHLSDPVFSSALIYAGGFAPTVALAAASYHLFEKRFIDLKERFSPVPSAT
ncbi:MAG TPA: acyltransferase [Opitutaceae bacterium]|nr:acyltransferase [Opitutaceae bacterium]